MPNIRSGIRTDEPPVTRRRRSRSSPPSIGVTGGRARGDGRGVQRGVPGRRVRPARPDGLATRASTPPKSNWARPVSEGPFEAYPIMAANVFTFGGLQDDAGRARSSTATARAIRGLCAAGEMTGLYYSNYTGSTSVLRGATFGRIAGARRRDGGLSMRIWHQSFTVLDDVPHYRDALRPAPAAQVAAPGTTVDLHGMEPGTYPSDYPGTHIGYAYLAGLHREQFVQRRAARAGRGLRRVPHRHDPGHRLRGGAHARRHPGRSRSGRRRC